MNTDSNHIVLDRVLRCRDSINDGGMGRKVGGPLKDRDNKPSTSS